MRVKRKPFVPPQPIIKKRGIKGEVKIDLNPSLQTVNIIYHCGRRIIDDFSNLREYAVEFLNTLEAPTFLAIYVVRRKGLETRLSIRMEGREYVVSAAEEWVTKWARRVYRKQKPIAICGESNLMLEFENIQSDNADFTVMPKPKKTESAIFTPFYYRDNREAKGVVALGGRFFSDIEPGVGRMFWSMKAGLVFAAHISYQLIHRFDAITGLKKLADWHADMKRIIEKGRRNGRQSWFLLLDLDHFKKINDMYGHEVGNIVLEKAAEILKNNIREGDDVYRMGGEEFGIILHNINRKNAQEVAERIRKALEESCIEVVMEDVKAVQEIHITASIGGAKIECKGAVAEECIEITYKTADANLYRAKRGGRNRVVF